MNKQVQNIKEYPGLTKRLIKNTRRSQKGLKFFKQLSEERNLNKFEQENQNYHKVCLHYSKKLLTHISHEGVEKAEYYLQREYNYKKMYDRKIYQPDPFKRYLLACEDAELDYEDCVIILEKYLRIFSNR